MTVLVVDDSLLVRRQVAAAMTRAGHEVIEATDGLDAKAKLGAHVALVICDLNMPRMNGLELLEWMRSDPAFAALPFVMLTTEASPEAAQRAKQLGAKGWIAKPFREDVVVAAVAKLIGSRVA